MIAFLLAANLASAQQVPDEVLNPIVVIGSEAEELNKPNSSHYISREKLKRQQDTDLTRTIKTVPGVYVREEEGYGLRPNIGLRGTNPDRSKKVNFMEDGVLIGPAPYSAPAAYYTPSMFHVDGMEVFKGVATVIYGPNSVGGTINFLTPVPQDGGFIEGSLGNFDYRKVIGRAGFAGEVYSGVIHGAYHETTGFKELPNNEGTGFEQADFMLKSRIRVKGGERPHFIDIKLGHAQEDSDETYLGLSEQDFYANPYQRYAASELDHMKWNHQTYQAGYTAALNDSSMLVLTGYWHAFKRNWYRFDHFNSNTSVRDVLNNPTNYQDLHQILKGELDSAALGGGVGDILIARNKRNFFSRGLQLQHLYSSGFNDVQWGLRIHEDQIRHNHGLDRYAMTSAHLVRTADARVVSKIDRNTSWSKAIFAKDEINLDPVRITLAARYERVESEARTLVVNDVFENTSLRNKDHIFVPGFGILYNFVPSSSVFLGINKGYSPVGPGQNDKVEPEETTNYELGFRYLKRFFFEAIGFYSDYRNIKGLCSFSAGCNANTEQEEFNGGEATIFGIESRLRYDLRVGSIKFPFELNYTYTSAEFDTTFRTQSPEWGDGVITKGTELPYVPEHQYTLSVGAEAGKIVSDIRLIWTGRQWDQAVEAGRKEVHAYGVVDWNTKYKFKNDTFAYLKIDNVLDNEYIVAYRPYGARPGKDRMIQIGFRQGF